MSSTTEAHRTLGVDVQDIGLVVTYRSQESTTTNTLATWCSTVVLDKIARIVILIDRIQEGITICAAKSEIHARRMIRRSSISGLTRVIT